MLRHAIGRLVSVIITIEEKGSQVLQIEHLVRLVSRIAINCRVELFSEYSKDGTDIGLEISSDGRSALLVCLNFSALIKAESQPQNSTWTAPTISNFQLSVWEH